jgi:hypothetical protein
LILRLAEDGFALEVPVRTRGIEFSGFDDALHGHAVTSMSGHVLRADGALANLASTLRVVCGDKHGLHRSPSTASEIPGSHEDAESERRGPIALGAADDPPERG